MRTGSIHIGRIAAIAGAAALITWLAGTALTGNWRPAVSWQPLASPQWGWGTMNEGNLCRCIASPNGPPPRGHFLRLGSVEVDLQ